MIGFRSSRVVEAGGAMARIAKGRDRVLTREEIAAETLRQFDTGSEAPSMRALAGALGVAPSAIYHHYESQAAIVQAATELVWEEVAREFLAAIPEPLAADPVEVLVTAGLVTRRTFARHYRIAPFLAASPEADDFMTEVLRLLEVVFERLGLTNEQAAVSFYAYSSFLIGMVLFSAARRIADEQLGIARKRAGGRRREDTRVPLDDAIDLPSRDPARDEELFAAGLRRLVQSFVPPRC
jgi:TetR/AcrR family transcriptional regulator, tetracycline repressor protein